LLHKTLIIFTNPVHKKLYTISGDLHDIVDLYNVQNDQTEFICYYIKIILIHY